MKRWEYMMGTCWFEQPDRVMVQEQATFERLLRDDWVPFVMAVDPGWPIRARVILRRRLLGLLR